MANPVATNGMGFLEDLTGMAKVSSTKKTVSSTDQRGRGAIGSPLNGSALHVQQNPHDINTNTTDSICNKVKIVAVAIFFGVSLVLSIIVSPMFLFGVMIAFALMYDDYRDEVFAREGLVSTPFGGRPI